MMFKTELLQFINKKKIFFFCSTAILFKWLHLLFWLFMLIIKARKIIITMSFTRHFNFLSPLRLFTESFPQRLIHFRSVIHHLVHFAYYEPNMRFYSNYRRVGLVWNFIIWRAVAREIWIWSDPIHGRFPLSRIPMNGWRKNLTFIRDEFKRGGERKSKGWKSSHFIKSIMSYYVTENHEMLARKLKLWGVFGPFSFRSLYPFFVPLEFWKKKCTNPADGERTLKAGIKGNEKR